MTRPQPLGSAPNSRWQRTPSSTTRPKRPRAPRPSPARRTALLGCQHGALRGPGVQNGGDQPGHHAARHRKHTESTLETRRNLQVIAWSLGDTQASEALIPSVLDTSSPITPDNRPHHHAGPPKTTAPSRTTRRGPRTSLLAATVTKHRRRILLLVHLVVFAVRRLSPALGRTTLDRGKLPRVRHILGRFHSRAVARTDPRRHGRESGRPVNSSPRGPLPIRSVPAHRPSCATLMVLRISGASPAQGISLGPH